MTKHTTTRITAIDTSADTVTHPGGVLREELEKRGIMQKDFAKKVDLRPSHLNELIKGKRHISAQVAIRLEKQLDIDASFWMRLQADFDLKMARLQLKTA